MMERSLFLRLTASTADSDELKAEVVQAFAACNVQVTIFVREGSGGLTAYAQVCFESRDRMLQAKVGNIG